MIERGITKFRTEQPCLGQSGVPVALPSSSRQTQSARGSSEFSVVLWISFPVGMIEPPRIFIVAWNLSFRSPATKEMFLQLPLGKEGCFAQAGIISRLSPIKNAWSSERKDKSLGSAKNTGLMMGIPLVAASCKRV